MIKQFPEFTPITLAHRPLLQEWNLQHPPQTSEYSFSNLFGWRNACGYALAQLGDGLLIRREDHGKMTFLQPLVSKAHGEAVKACFEYLQAAGHAGVIERVAEDFVHALGTDPGWTIHEDRDQFDYLYLAAELRELAGERFHDKKNLLNQFQRKYQANYLPLTADIAHRCIEFAHEWCEDRRCMQYPGLREENCAVVQMLLHFAELELIGGALEIAGKLVAFTIAEKLNPPTLVIHAEKAKQGITGIYQAINQQFLLAQTDEVIYVNREQDLGLPGLRKAKLSYNPTALLKKFRIESSTLDKHHK